jgi:hypothetical protein
MTSTNQLPLPPSGNYLSWMTNHPDEFSAYLQTVFALSRMEVVLTINGVTKRFPLKITGQNAIVEINIS